MPVKVSLCRDSTIIHIEASGQVMRREVGWASERVRELLTEHGVAAVMVDASGTQEQSSATLSAEMISGFLYSLETELPLAFIRSSLWSAPYREQVLAKIYDAPANASFFDDSPSARQWLGQSSGACTQA